MTAVNSETYSLSFQYFEAELRSYMLPHFLVRPRIRFYSVYDARNVSLGVRSSLCSDMVTMDNVLIER